MEIITIPEVKNTIRFNRAEATYIFSKTTYGRGEKFSFVVKFDCKEKNDKQNIVYVHDYNSLGNKITKFDILKLKNTVENSNILYNTLWRSVQKAFSNQNFFNSGPLGDRDIDFGVIGNRIFFLSDEIGSKENSSLVYKASIEQIEQFLQNLQKENSGLLSDINNLYLNFMIKNINYYSSVVKYMFMKPKDYYEIYFIRNTVEDTFNFVFWCLKDSKKQLKIAERLVLTNNKKLDAIPKNVILNIQDYFTEKIDIDRIKSFINASYYVEIFLSSCAIINKKQFIIYENVFNKHKQILYQMFNRMPDILK